MKFCPKIRAHDKIKLAEETFKYSRRLRLKEFFNDLNNPDTQTTFINNDEDFQRPFFNKLKSTFTPFAGRDMYLDFYITAITEEILQSASKKRQYSNITKEELASLRKLSQDDSIVIKKADKSNTSDFKQNRL